MHVGHLVAQVHRTTAAGRRTAILSVASCSLLRMDDNLATVIPFPLHRVRSRPDVAALEPTAREEYWELVQRLAAERRDLGRGAG